MLSALSSFFGSKKPVPVRKPATTHPVRKQATAVDTTALPWIHSFADITYDTIHTGKEGDFNKGITDEIRKGFIAVGTARTATLLVDPSFYAAKRSLYRSVAGQLQQAGIRVEQTYFAEAKLIASLYETEASLASRNATIGESGGPAERLWMEIIERGLALGATDLHVQLTGRSGTLLYRVNGELMAPKTQDKGVYPLEELRDAVAYAYNKLHAERTNNDAGFGMDKDLECMVPFDNGKRRFNIRYTGTAKHEGYAVYLRYLFSESLDWSTPQAAGYSDDQADMLNTAIRSRKGATVFCGITGSGKSTTAKYCLESIPGSEGLNIITIEHPVEYPIKGTVQITMQETSSDVWRRAQKKLMRSDPDVIFISEVRCLNSGETAKTMIDTGHPLFFTVHAASVLDVFSRLTDKSIGFSMETITGPNFWQVIVYQALVQVLCEHCKLSAEDHIPNVLRFLEQRFDLDTSRMHVRNTDGCKHCHNGISGQEVVAEMLQPNRAILAMLRAGDIFGAEKLWRGTSDGRFDSPDMTGKTVFEHALYKAYTGRIDPRSVETFEAFERFEIIK